MNDIRHIVFDIGRVLIHYDPEIPYRDLIPDAARRRWFLETVCTSAWNIEQDRGRCWQEAEDLLVADHPDHEALIRAFRRNWHAMVPHSYEESVAIYETLIAEGRDVTLLTNFAADTFGEARKRYVFLEQARGVTVSGEIGLIKPDRAIYERHAESFGLAAAHTLFIDDSPANVEGARAAGWNAVHFTDGAALRADLRRHGVLA